MHRLTRISLRHPRAIWLLLALVTLALGAGLPGLRTEFGYRVLIGDDHPSIRTLDGFIERFGGGLPIQIAWECGEGRPCGTVFDAASLQMAHAVTHALSSVDRVRKVESPANAPLLVPAPNGFAVRRFVEHGSPVADTKVLAARALTDPLWVGNLVSADGRVGSIIVQASDTESETDLRVVEAVERALAPFQAQGFEFHLVGDPVATVVVGRDLAASTGRLIPLTVTVIALILYALSRSWRGTAATLATMSVALLWTFGLLGWLDWPQDGILEVLAPLILVVGVCDAVHLLARHAEETAMRGGTGQRRDGTDAILAAARDVGPPCLFTSLTTAGAFLSFATSDLATFVRFGVISTFGVLSCLVLTFTLLPLLARTLPAGARSALRASRTWDSALSAVIRTSQRRAAPILAATAAVFLACGIGWLAHLRVDTDFYETFGERSRVMRWIRFVEARLRPSSTLELEVALPATATLEEPANLRAVEEFSGFLSHAEGLGASTSILDVLRRLNRLLHDDDPAFERIGETAAANAELLELVGFEDPGLMDSWISLDRSRLRISVEAPVQSASRSATVLEAVNSYASSELPPGWSVWGTGELAINLDWIREVQSTQLRSFPAAFGLVFLMAAFFLGSLRLAAAAMVPTLLPVVVTLGTMGWVGMSLDVGRAMIAAVLLGIAVDDSIHLLNQYRRQRALRQEPREAMRHALQHVGRAVVTTSIALSLGFLTLMASAWQTISSFGFFVSLAILGALAATVFVLPALLFAFSSRSAREVGERNGERREARSAARRMLLTFALVVLVAGSVALAAVHAARPGHHKELACWVLPNARVALLSGPASECPLRAQDAIRGVQVGAVPHAVDDLEGLQAALGGASSRVGIAVTRGGESRWHDVAVASVSPVARALRVVSAALIAAVLLGIPVLLLWRSTSPAAPPFALLYGSLCVVLVTVIAGRGAPWLNRLALGATVLAPAALAHLAFAFPRERKVARESPRIVLIPYLVSALLAPVAWVAMERNPLLWPTVVYLLLALSAGAWLILLSSCWFAVRESTSALERARARLLLYGAALLPLLPMPLLARYGGGTPGTLGVYLGISAVLMPLPIGLAISRYNLFNLQHDVRRWIARLVHCSVGASVLMAVLAIALAASRVDHPLRAPPLLFAVSFVSVALVETIRNRILGWVEARLSPRVQVLRDVRAEYAQRIAELRESDQVARLLGETLQAALAPRSGCVFLVCGGAWRPAHPFGADTLAGLDLVPDALRALRGRSIVQLEGGEETQDDAVLVGRAGVEVIAALGRGDETLGLVLLGASGRGLPYSGLDLDFVAMAVEHAAMALRNAGIARALLAAERKATTGSTALALAHDVGKDVGLIRMLARRLPERSGDPERTRRDLNLIQDLAAEIAKTLRGFVRDAASPMSEPPGTIPFEHVVERAVRAVSRIHGTGRVTQSIDPRLRSVRTHENLERVLLNVLDNALRASEKTDGAHLFATLEDDSIRISVSDRGCGISSKNLEEAFRLGFTTRRQRGGSGVGLAVSREIVSALGGSIELAPNPGGGTVARMRLPTISRRPE